jgi:hypothetical chaperone protein
MQRLIGVDFGTTNSIVAELAEDGTVRTHRFPHGNDVFRTLLCFWAEAARGRQHLHHAAGPAAVTAYLEDPLDSRLIMSMKTYLAQRSFSETRIFGRPFTLERLVALFLRSLLPDGELHGAVIVAGRPVRFAGESADDTLGETRLRAAYAEAGFATVEVALEPEAAGWRFARTLTKPAVVLIGDFGGGTSDFSVLRFVPGAAGSVQALGHAGIGIAGDVFDFRIIDHVVSPLLGKGDSYTVMGKELPVPPEFFSAFARWHRLSLMRTPKTLREIGEVARRAAHPERLQALIALIENELGYRLYEAVAATKAALSVEPEAVLRFDAPGLALQRLITREEFETWIADDLARIAATVDQALGSAGVAATDVDHVFLTGGTSFVPVVRALFERRFGADAVSAGGEFVSVAEGLALIGRERMAAADAIKFRHPTDNIRDGRPARRS